MSKDTNLRHASIIDNSGRVVVSKKLLHTLGWEGVIPVNVEIEDNKVILSLRDARKCDKCDKEVKSEFTYCPYCGEKL